VGRLDINNFVVKRVLSMKNLNDEVKWVTMEMERWAC